MQSGVGLWARVGLTVADFLTQELGLSEEQQGQADVLMLDGMPVDDPATAIVPPNARLALAAGLPGIVGLSLKKDSAIKVLRATITHFEQDSPDPRPGRVTLCLYSLVLPLLAGHFLRRGVLISHQQFQRYAGRSPSDNCRLDGRVWPAAELARELAGAPPAEFLLTAVITPETEGQPHV
jgi:hypothetical protein